MAERAPGRMETQPIFNDWTLGFVHYLARGASSYWEQRRGEHSMPAARDLKPREMKAFLPHVKLVSVLAGTHGGYDFKVRLVGDETRHVFGNISNKFLNEFLSPDIEARWRLAFEAVCTRKIRLRNHGTVAFQGKEWLEYEVLVAPLGQGQQVTDLLVVFVSWPRGEQVPTF